MAQNEFLRKRDERDRRFFMAGMMTGAQLVTDFVSQSLHDPAVMGKTRVLNRGSIDKIFDNCSKLDDHFCLAFSNHVEADYIRDEWDAVMRDIYEDDAAPFTKRYPYAKEFQYLKPQKGWVD